MPNQKITELSNIGFASIDDIIPIVDAVGTFPVTKKITVGALFTSPVITTGIIMDNGVIDGGAVYFDGGTTSFIKSSADGLTLTFGGFTTLAGAFPSVAPLDHAHIAVAGQGGTLTWANALSVANAGTHAHSGNTSGGQLDWDTCWADAVHSHASNAEGGTLDWDNVWADAVHDHSSDAEGGNNLAPASITASRTPGAQSWTIKGTADGVGNSQGIYGYATGTGDTLFRTHRGVLGEVDVTGNGTNYGVEGRASNGAIAVGIYGTATGATTNWAGYFASGDVKIENFLISDKISGALVRPETTYLYRSDFDKSDGSSGIRLILDKEIFDEHSEFTSTTFDGSATATTANHLIDTTNNPFTAGDVGKVAHNNTTGKDAIITNYNSASDVTLQDDIFTNGDDYIIHKSIFTVTTAGYYHVDINIGFAGDNDYVVYLYKNGSTELNAFVANDQRCICCSGTFYLAANDYLCVNVRTTVAYTGTFSVYGEDTSLGVTNFSVHRVN